MKQLDRPVVCPMCGHLWDTETAYSWWTADAVGGGPRPTCYGCTPAQLSRGNDLLTAVTTPTPWTADAEWLDDTPEDVQRILDRTLAVLDMYPEACAERSILLQVADGLHDRLWPAGASTPSTPSQGQPPVLTCAPATPPPLQPIQVGELRPGPSVRTRPARSASPGITDHATSMHDHAEQLTFFGLDQAPAPTPLARSQWIFGVL